MKEARNQLITELIGDEMKTGRLWMCVTAPICLIGGILSLVFPIVANMGWFVACSNAFLAGLVIRNFENYTS
jgi:hypothetical protein